MAAQILMPKAAILSSLLWKHYNLEDVAHDLGVSLPALEIRMKTLGIDAEQLRERWEADRPEHL